MANKIFIGLFVILFAASGCLGYFTYHLSDQLNVLNNEQKAFEQNTANKFAAVHTDITNLSANLTAFETDTGNRFTNVQGQITDLNSQFTGYQAKTDTRLNTAESNIKSISANLSDLQKRFSAVTMDVRGLYDNVVKSICMIISEYPQSSGYGQGSGFIYSADGYVVTCWHVITGASNILVKLHDGSLVSASIVGSDKYSDIAVLRLRNVSNLTPLTLADSGTLTGGEPVMAIGNPLGIFESVTYGIVSQTKAMQGADEFTWAVSNLIQIDAPVNPGNSGGPLINNKGQVVGIANIAYSEYQGIAWAISSNKIKRVAQAIINYGSFIDATLPGCFTMDDMSPDQAFTMGLSSCFGIWIKSVQCVGELLKDDVIIAVDGMQIKDTAGLFCYIGEFKSVDDTITLTIIRNHVQRNVQVTLQTGWVFTD